MKITSIKKSANNKYILIIDNKKHIILGDVLLELNIFKPCDISDSVYKQIIDINNYYIAYNKIINYVSFKMRTENEIRKKLKTLGVDNRKSLDIINDLKNKGYINNNRYIEAYINDQVNLGNNGPKKIKRELIKLGFENELIDNYLDNVTDDIWQEKINKIINKKIKANHNLSLNRFKLKTKQDLLNLGYDNIDEYVNDIYFDESSIREKEYNKLYQKYSKKYDEDKIELFIKQKLIQEGFNIN